MSEFKGTPGSWGIEKTKNDWWVGQLRPDGKVDLIVARFPTGIEYSETYIDRNKSDALLISAAPDLLKALMLRKEARKYGLIERPDLWKKADEAEDKAIAKALGEDK